MSAAEWSQRHGPLDGLLRSAGARMHDEHGVSLPADFGSSASELAVCLGAVGIGVLDEDDEGETLAIVGPRAEALLRAAVLDALPVTVLREGPVLLPRRDAARAGARGLAGAG